MSYGVLIYYLYGVLIYYLKINTRNRELNLKNIQQGVCWCLDGDVAS